MMLLEDILDVLGVKLRHIHKFMPNNTMLVCIRQTGLTFLPVSAPPAKDGALKVPYEDVTMKIDYVSESRYIEKLTIVDEENEYTFIVNSLELYKNNTLLHKYSPYRYSL
jgi:hypothetical protein